MNQERQIEVDVNILAAKANQLKNVTDRARQCVAGMIVLSDELSAVWRGEAADALKQEIAEDIAETNRMILKLEETRGDFDVAIGMYKETEDNILALIKTLDNGG